MSFFQKRIKTGDPGAESEREVEFQRNKQVLVSAVRRVIGRCRDRDEKEEIPFINSLLQNYDNEDKVRLSGWRCNYIQWALFRRATSVHVLFDWSIVATRIYPSL